MRFPRTTALDFAPPDPLPDDIALLFGKCREKLGPISGVPVACAHNSDNRAQGWG